jgi:DNA polymerase-3 subunit gamma/tau
MELPEEEMEILKKQADKFEFDQLNHLFNLLLKGEEEIAQSTFPRTMLEMTLIRMATLRPVLPVDDILKKLEGFGRDHSEGEPSHSVEPSPPVKIMNSKNAQTQRGKKETSPSGHEKTEKGEGTERQKLSADLATEGGSVPRDETKGSDELEEGVGDKGLSQRVKEETWKGLVDFTRARNPIIGSFLALGSLIHVSDDKIEIGFEKDSFHYERIMEEENRSQLESICHEYLQRKAKLIVSSLDQGGVSRGRIAIEEERKGSHSSEKPLMKEGEGNSLIQEALRLFDGKIVET